MLAASSVAAWQALDELIVSWLMRWSVATTVAAISRALSDDVGLGAPARTKARLLHTSARMLCTERHTTSARLGIDMLRVSAYE